MRLIRIPQRFLIDHGDRDLPTPEVVKSTQNHFWIKADDPHLGELISDAKYYAEPYIEAKPGDYVWGVVVSARATLKAIVKAGVSWNQYYETSCEAQ
tara:strand:- start:466 stop:756 length:291 start_codon:yes stop_codon:yes gene_type:complete